VNIRRGSVAKGPQSSMGRSEPAIFSNFDRHIFGTFTAEVNVIMQRHGLPYRLFSDPKAKVLDLQSP